MTTLLGFIVEWLEPGDDRFTPLRRHFNRDQMAEAIMFEFHKAQQAMRAAQTGQAGPRSIYLSALLMGQEGHRMSPAAREAAGA